jgi:hypothetical protein
VWNFNPLEGLLFSLSFGSIAGGWLVLKWRATKKIDFFKVALRRRIKCPLFVSEHTKKAATFYSDEEGGYAYRL